MEVLCFCFIRHCQYVNFQSTPRKHNTHSFMCQAFLNVFYQPLTVLSKSKQLTFMKPDTRIWIIRLLFCCCRPSKGKKKKCSGWKFGTSVPNTWEWSLRYKTVLGHLLISGIWVASTSNWGAHSLSDFQSKFNKFVAFRWCDKTTLLAEVVFSFPGV